MWSALCVQAGQRIKELHIGDHLDKLAVNVPLQAPAQQATPPAQLRM